MHFFRSTLLVTGMLAFALGLALLPSVPFRLEPMVELGAPIGEQRDVTIAQYNFRKDVIFQYFSWAVLSITLAGFVLVQFSNQLLQCRGRYLVLTSVCASTLSVLAGVVQLEVLAELLQHQTLPSSWLGPMSSLPALQFGLLTYAAFSAFAALSMCVFSKPSQGGS